MNLDKLIDQFIGEDEKDFYPANQYLEDCAITRNQLRQDLKSRKQELTKRIVEVIYQKGVDIQIAWKYLSEEQKTEIIKELTGK